MRDKLFRKGLVAGIIVLLFGISLMPLAGSLSIEKYVSKASPYGVDLTCDEPYMNVKQGATALFVVEIINIGTIDDTYDVIAGSIEDIVCKVNGVNADQFNPYEFTLMSGESTTFVVTAEVWESVPTGEWSVIIEAHSQNNSEVYDELTLTANVQKKNRVISDVENDCGCQVVNRYDLLRVKLLLVRIKVITNILLLRFGFIPEVADKCSDILENLDLNKLQEPPIICAILESIENQLWDILYFISDLVEEYQNNPIILRILGGFVIPIELIGTFVYNLGIALGCK